MYRKQKKILLYKVLHICINIWRFELTYIAILGLCSSVYALHCALPEAESPIKITLHWRIMTQLANENEFYKCNTTNENSPCSLVFGFASFRFSRKIRKKCKKTQISHLHNVVAVVFRYKKFKCPRADEILSLHSPRW